ncbi:MAG TPA: SMI1/KNR4 family protein [Thermoanaerobaculia bacterium]|nr:SMI1/KNR4 family protein [Thermoanaerobaculia bacterium]
MLSRRDLVRIAGLSVAGAALGGCDPSSFNRGLPEMRAARESARKHASRETLIQALERIRAWSEAENPVVARALQPGLSEAEIDERTSELPFRLPREVRWLYGWRNGTGGAGDFLLYHHWLSLEDAIKEYRGLRDLAIVGWDERWFPVFSFQEEYFFLPCGKEPEEALPVLFYFTENTDTPISFTSLTTLAVTQAEALETGAAWVQDKKMGFLEMHNGSYSKIHQRHNPGATYPYYIDPRDSPPPARRQ